MFGVWISNLGCPGDSTVDLEGARRQPQPRVARGGALRWAFAIGVAVLLTTSMGGASTLSAINSWSDGEQLEADELNSNFTLLATQLDALTASLAPLGLSVGPPLTDLYVDPIAGDDTNSGGLGEPLQTLQAAFDRVPAVLLASLTIHLASGTYADVGAPTGLGVVPEYAARIRSIRSVNGAELIISGAPGGGAEMNGVATAGLTPRVGLLIEDCDAIVVQDLAIGGYAETGAAVRRSRLRWIRGAVVGHSGPEASGLLLDRFTEAHASEIEARGNTFGLVARRHSMLECVDCTVSDVTGGGAFPEVGALALAWSEVRLVGGVVEGQLRNAVRAEEHSTVATSGGTQLIGNGQGEELACGSSPDCPVAIESRASSLAFVSDSSLAGNIGGTVRASLLSGVEFSNSALDWIEETAAAGEPGAAFDYACLFANAGSGECETRYEAQSLTQSVVDLRGAYPPEPPYFTPTIGLPVDTTSSVAPARFPTLWQYQLFNERGRIASSECREVDPDAIAVHVDTFTTGQQACDSAGPAYSPVAGGPPLSSSWTYAGVAFSDRISSTLPYSAPAPFGPHLPADLFALADTGSYSNASIGPLVFACCIPDLP